MKDIATAFDRYSDEHPRIAVIGDIMLDEHVTVDVLGISPEDDLAWKLKSGTQQASLVVRQT
mgnify:CR=1 FL=1